jgi:diacylglycerol kinase family enzyme
VETKGRGHATELARAAGSDAIFAYGGDGLFNEVINGLDGSRPVGFLPGGHTSVLSRALGFPRDPVAAAEHIVLDRTRRISLGRANGRRFGFAAGIGVGAVAVRRVDEMGRTSDGRRPSDLTFAKIIVECLLHSWGPDLEIVGLGRVAMVFVSNDAVFSCAGAAPMRLSPAARFELGLDLAAPRRVNRRTLMRLAPRVALGRGLAGASVVTGHDLDRIEVTCDRPRPLQTDGEDLGDVETVVFEAERDALTVFAP